MLSFCLVNISDHLYNSIRLYPYDWRTTDQFLYILQVVFGSAISSSRRLLEQPEEPLLSTVEPSIELEQPVPTALPTNGLEPPAPTALPNNGLESPVSAVVPINGLEPLVPVGEPNNGPETLKPVVEPINPNGCPEHDCHRLKCPHGLELDESGCVTKCRCKLPSSDHSCPTALEAECRKLTCPQDLLLDDNLCVIGCKCKAPTFDEERWY